MISIVIILKNDLGVIDTISGLDRQDYKGKYEIIVVDRSTIKYPTLKTSVPLKWINYNSGGKRYTIPEQRNIGIKESTGDVVVFIDANCMPNRDWLRLMMEPIRKEGESIVSGQTLSKGGFTLNDHQYSRLKEKKYLDDAATIALAVKMDVFGKVGVFDEEFEYSSDTDFTWRAVMGGFKIRYQPNAISFHDWGDVKRETKRNLLYGRGAARLLIKHWSTHWKTFLTDRSVVILYPILIMGLPFTLLIPYYPCVFLLLVLKNANQPNPFGIVLKHIIFGWGAITEFIRTVKQFWNK